LRRPHLSEWRRTSFKEYCPLCYEQLVDNYHLSFFGELQKCRQVVSTSLHGLIFSHAWNIPVVAIRIGNNVAGGSWKYMHSLGNLAFDELFYAWGKSLSFPDWVRLVDQEWQPPGLLIQQLREHMCCLSLADDA
jgi:hypothetical protein